MNAKRVLMLDDNYYALSLLSEVLQDSGYKVVFKTDISDITEDIFKEIDVFVVDYFVGKKTSDDLVKKAKSINSALCIVVISGKSDTGLIQKLLTDEVIDYFLKKPFSAKDLLRIIGSA